jgi:A/G-specific adenine glycosylase
LNFNLTKVLHLIILFHLKICIFDKGYFSLYQMHFSKEIISWYLNNKRDLPWRNTKNPYHIWLSEIILQQTRVEQGLPYYLKFITHFPTIFDLANAKESDVLKLWQGLGYYSRARNLHQAAQYIAFELKGVFPSTKKELETIKGIGPYTASAIASFVNNEPCAVLDGNVFRVISRYLGIETPINTNEGKNTFSKLADELLNKKNPGLHNQAIMEFGALHCKPANPKCDDCSLNLSCFAYQNNRANELPVKIKKNKIKNRYLNYFIIQTENGFVVQKRNENDIWKGLYEFPLHESDSDIFEDVSTIKTEFKAFSIDKITSVSKLYKHILTHQHLYARFISCETKDIIKDKNFLFLNQKTFKNLAVPRLIEKYIIENNLF